MILLKIAGIVLTGLSTVSGIALYINAIKETVKDATALIWLFCCSLAGGPFIYRLGTGANDGFVYVSCFVFILGTVSAITLLLAEIGLIAVKSRTTLWVFFLTGIPLGARGIYVLVIN